MQHQPANIDKFNALTVHILTTLYDAFPTPVPLQVDELARAVAPPAADVETFREWEHVATSTVSWLVEEDFIRVQRAVYGGYVGVRLSIRGLTALGYVPVSLKANETPEPLINRLKRAAAKGVEGSITEGVTFLLGQIFRLSLSLAVTSTGNAGVNV